MKMLVIGNGYIGNAFSDYFKCPIWPKRIETYEDAKEACQGKDIIINCAGYTDVDGCEENPTKAYKENVYLPMLLKEHAKRLVQFSTLCTERYHSNDKEKDTVYARTKRLGESYGDLIIRIRLPFGSYSHPKNFLDKIKKFKHFHDIDQSFTCLDDLFRSLEFSIGSDYILGIDYVNNLYTSPYKIAKIIGLNPIKSDFDLIKTKTKRLNIKISGQNNPHVYDALFRIIEKRKNG